MSKLDDLDREILAALRQNARISVASLSAATGASRATITSRIQRMVDDQTIGGFTIKTAADGETRGIRAVVLIEVIGKYADAVAKRLRGIPQVRALHSTNGRWDLIAELESKDLGEFDELLRQLRMIEGINSTESNILLRTVKLT